MGLKSGQAGQAVGKSSVSKPVPKPPLILCSGQERLPYREACNGEISGICEPNGLDYLWTGSISGKTWGVQRKQFPEDFLDSLWGEGQRLGKEMLQIRDAWSNIGLDEAFLVLEGRARWSGDGDDARLIHKASQFTQQQMSKKGLERLLWRIQTRNQVNVEWIDNGAAEFGRWIRNMAEFSNQIDKVGDGVDGTRGRHGFDERPRPNESAGERVRRWRSWILQGIDGIGPGLAEKLLRYCPNPLVWRGDVSQDLERIAGPMTGKKLRELLEKIHAE